MQTVIYTGSAQSLTYVQSPSSTWDFQSTILLFNRAQEKPIQTHKFTQALVKPPRYAFQSAAHFVLEVILSLGYTPPYKL